MHFPDILSQRTIRPQNRTATIQVRGFDWLLMLVTLLALVPMVKLGASQFISYDGYWHLFTATQNKWRLFLSEWRADAHPPLYYVVLRFWARLGHSHLVYRSMSILPGAAGTYMMGKVGKRLFESAAPAILAAFAYGFSVTLIEIFCDVRGYPLALLFVVAAFWCFIRLLERLPDRNASRFLLGWSVLSSLGVLTEYYVSFFILACFAVLCIQVLWVPQFRKASSRFVREMPSVVGLALAMLCCTATWLYFVHLRYQPAIQNNVAQFYWAPGQPVLRFLWSQLCSDLAFLLPVGLRPPLLVSLTSVFVVCAMVYTGFIAGSRTRQSLLRSIPALMLAFLLSQLAILSLLRRYPFGGFERQQSIIYPFLILLIFSVCDLAFAWLPSLRLRILSAIAVAALIAAHFVFSWAHMLRFSEELFSGGYRAFRSELPDVHAIYVDQFSLVAYYTHTHKWNWKFKEHFRVPERVDEYRTVSPSGEQSVVLRNLDQWNFDLLNPSTYQVLAAVLRDSHLQQVNLFFFKQGGELTRRDTASEQRQIRELAARSGLAAGPMVYDNGPALITFTVR